MQEILLLVLVVAALFLLPRLTARKPERMAVSRPVQISARMRLAVLLSTFWVLAAALFTKPWGGGWERFLLLGVAPLLAFWGTLWVLSGRRKRRR